ASRAHARHGSATSSTTSVSGWPFTRWTWTGTALCSTSEPLPSWPPPIPVPSSMQFVVSPQHHTVPSGRIPHVKSAPPVAATTSVTAPAASRTCTGVDSATSAITPLPSWPSSFSPEHHIVPSYLTKQLCWVPWATSTTHCLHVPPSQNRF